MKIGRGIALLPVLCYNIVIISTELHYNEREERGKNAS